jgi:hypothetical protein
MHKNSTAKKTKRLKKGLPHPIRFDDTEKNLIGDLQDRTEPTMSVNEIMRRAVRFAVPKFLSGEAPLTELKPKAAPATNGS